MVKLTLVRPKDLTHEEMLRLFAARELNIGKPTEFARMLLKVWDGSWELLRIDGSITGVAVVNQEGERLNIFYLHGDGLFGKMTALTDRLLDIAAERGLKGLSCCTRDLTRARLFRMTPGAKVEHRGNWYFLELDHGR